MKRVSSLLIAIFMIFIAIPASAQSWKDLHDSAAIYLQQRNNTKAIEFYLQAEAILEKDSMNTLTLYNSSNGIAELYVAIGQYAKAEPYYIKAKKIIEGTRGRESAEYANCCNNLGWLYRLTGNYPQAETLLIEAKNLREKMYGKNHPDYATSCNRLAVIYADVGQYDDARPLYTEAMQIREKVLGKDHIDYAMSCNNMGVFYMLTGNMAAAEPFHLEAKRIREKVLGKQNVFYAASCNNLGVLYLDLGQYRKAETYYLEAKQIRGEIMGKEHPEYAGSCDNLAVLLMDMGRYEEAEALYHEGMRIREKTLGVKHMDYARSCNNLGLLYRNLGQYEKSKTLFIEANNIIGSVLGKEHPEFAKNSNNLGALYMDMGDFDNAAMHYSEARKIWEKVLGKDHPEYAKSCNNLAVMYYYKKQLPQAAEYFLETNRIREKSLGKDNPDYAASSDNLAVVYTDMGQYDKAIPYHTIAFETRKRMLGTQHPDFLQSCINNANMYWNLRDFKKAQEFYEQAFGSGQVQIEKIFRFTTEPEKFSYLKKITDFKNYFLSFSSAEGATTNPGYAYAVSLANRNLTLSSSRRLRESIFNTSDTNLHNLYNEWIAAREQLAFWYARPVADRKDTINALEEKANTLEKELTRSSEQFRLEQQSTRWDEIQERLKPGEASIEFSMFRYFNGKRWTDSTYYMAIVLRQDSKEPVMVRLFEQKELDGLLNYRSTSPGAVRLNYLYADRAKGKDLYDLIWKPIEKHVAGIKTIYFAPAGSLHKISFAALAKNNKEVLSDEFTLLQLNSTANIGLPAVTGLQTNDKIILYGGVQYDVDSTLMRKAAVNAGTNDIASRTVPSELLREGVAEFYYLGGAEREVAAIGRLAEENRYSATVSYGITATEESFKDLSGLHAPAVLHIATHGFFFPDPKENKKDEGIGSIVFRQSDNPLIRSGLALAGANNAWKGKPVIGIEDGILTSYEVSNMYLPKTRLAVLSACETGLGDIQGSEGVYGLQRAFKLAGVESLVMSLWKVPDVETAAFMQEFYKNIFASQDISTAFYTAQTTLKNKYRQEPFKWAAWILVR